MLDERPLTTLRIRPQDVARRAALEHRKLREMITFCYAESCYRAFILGYFGDSRHSARCGMCSNCVTSSSIAQPGKTRTITSEREDDETLIVRKILAGAARMQGRFGKGMLASSLRGSRARNVLDAGLDKLSTYGILDGRTQDELLVYIDALVVAGCLRVTPGAYPTVSLSELGGDVMRQRAHVELALKDRGV